VLGPGLAARGADLDQQRLGQQWLLGDGAQQAREGGAEARPPARGAATLLEHFRAEPVSRHLVGLSEAGLLAAEAALEALARDPRALQHLLHARLLVATCADAEQHRFQRSLVRGPLRDGLVPGPNRAQCGRSVHSGYLNPFLGTLHTSYTSFVPMGTRAI